MKQPKVRIGLPVYESYSAHTVASLLSIAQLGPFEFRRGTWIDEARNELMRTFEKEDLLLMLDSDMVFEPAHVGKLLEAITARPECGAISGHYITRNGSNLPTCDWRVDGGWLDDERRRRRAARHTQEGDLVEVDSFGGGFLVITQEAKEKIGHPWFKTLYQDSGDYLGEDTFFCQRLQEEGFLPSVHFGICVGHVGQHVFVPNGR